jgi:cell division protein FtsL
MIRVLNAFMVALTVLICFGLYRITYEAQDRAAELQRVEERIGEAHSAISVLKAEWTHLSQPARIQTLASRHLTLQPIAASQISLISNLPLREVTGTSPDAIGALPLAPHASAPGTDQTLSFDAPLPRPKPFAARAG